MHWLQIAGFEFRTRVRRLSSAVYFLVFFTLSGLWMAASGGVFADADMGFGASHVAINSPFTLARMTVILTAFSMIVVAALMGRALQEDVETRTASFFASAPISKADYLLGRFLGAYGVVALILLSVPLGAWCASYLPEIEPGRLEPNHVSAYAMPYLLLALPDAFLVGTMFFCIAGVTRRMLPVYVGSVMLIVLWIASGQWMQDLDSRLWVAISDPFGRRALDLVTRYWTAPERNQRTLLLTGSLLDNRAFWMLCAVVIGGLFGWRFSFERFAADAPPSRRDQALVALKQPVVMPVTTSGPALSSGWQFAANAAVPRYRVVPLARTYLRGILGNVYFGVLVFAGVALAIALSVSAGKIYGTSTWPVTFQMLDSLLEPFEIFMLIIITFYAGELVWHERDARIDQIVDATAVPTSTLYAAKFLALMAVPALLLVVLMLVGIGVQLSEGYTRLQIGLYLHAFFGIQLIDLWMLCALAFTLHAVLNHKYLSHFVLVLFYIGIVASSGLGFEDNLYKFGETADMVYSDMNGFGHALVAERAFEVYWGACSLLLLIFGLLMIRRGTPASLRERLGRARFRIDAPLIGLTVFSGAVFIAAGGYIFYDTHILNAFETSEDIKRGQAEYEKTYRSALIDMPQPKITAVALQIEIDPHTRAVNARGRYTLENRTDQALSLINVDFPADQNFRMKNVAIDRTFTRTIDDNQEGMRQLRLAKPLLPGEKAALTFSVALDNPGFTAGHEQTAVVGNGSFFTGRLLLPHIGYDAEGELARPADRAKYGLPPRPPMRSQNDAKGLAVNYIADDADLIDFEADVSTSLDQIAVAPGHLLRTYQSGEHQHYVYHGSQPMLNFFAFQSARYTTVHDIWKGPHGDVPIDIDYQAGHEFDLDRMFAGARDALTYNSANFSDYQYPEFRIVEFPRYQQFAESFPNTTPYSEGIGFIARVKSEDPKDIDYPYFVTAHEVSHQWWGYQLVGANVQGATMLSETLAQYSALMVMKHRYGDVRMRRFLSYELDSYLTGRANEVDREVPLEQVEGQTYIHYAKGSLVMYALQDAIGEDTVNRVLSEMLKAHARVGAPYPVSSELVQRFKDAAPDDLKGFVADLFERIVIYDNRAVSAIAHRLPDGRYQVTLRVHAEKRRGDGAGNETLMPIDDWIDVGALDRAGNAVALTKVHFTSPDQELNLVMPELPERAGIDPLHKLIDRSPAEGTVAVELVQ
jgi:ABC-type transport system involved in multi-copper enzyme maturation permease subunit